MTDRSTDKIKPKNWKVRLITNKTPSACDHFKIACLHATTKKKTCMCLTNCWLFYSLVNSQTNAFWDEFKLFYLYPPFVAFFKAPARSGTQKKSRPHDTRWSAILKLTPSTGQPNLYDVEWLPSNPKWREVFFGDMGDSCWKLFQRNTFLWFRLHHVDVLVLVINWQLAKIPWLIKNCWRS